ncbi:sulfite exporter TauE/SafE family protein [Flavobacterium psychrotrophum]|uniref:sulfite exporter TauE/SafE family protein n=1 Tax=Flavobacterium psychrotrophum TaxID=2294119 RepID=UPI000E316BA4|nr:sulfite exporter TauE/SafE family protein [Flavobacterium psychrotrophum]
MTRIILQLERATDNISFRHIAITMLILKMLIISYFGYLIATEIYNGTLLFDSMFFVFMGVGFVAQIVDGALGMAYGVSCTTLLMNFGIPASLATASVHTSEIFTTGISGLSHIKFKNIDKKLFFKIVITGTLGAVAGAYLISDFFDAKVIKPYISGYLVLLGAYIIYKGIRNKKTVNQKVKRAPLLALIGGFLDTTGGGGWGPIVTSNLISQGKDPREVIGTVNTAEFFITYAATVIFTIILGVKHWQIILGLITGGALAAPFGAYLASKINKRLLFFMVGTLIIIISSYSLLQLL